MKRTATHWLIMTVMLVGMSAGLGTAVAQRGNADEKAPKKGAWLPPEEDREAYRDIVDFNIFRSDRGAVTRAVDLDRNPPEPREPTRRPTERTVDRPPPNPDASWRLTGISHDERSGAVAYIEHTSTGKLSRIEGPKAFSQGEITAIGYDAIVYVVETDQRVVQIGETLVGERVLPKGATPGTSRSSRGSSSGGSLQDRLKALREQRAQEQGTAPPPGTETPAQPSGDNAAPAKPDNTAPEDSDSDDPDSDDPDSDDPDSDDPLDSLPDPSDRPASADDDGNDNL